MININRLKKEEILFLARRKCKHGHSYLEHIQCAVNNGINFAEEKVGFLDIETTGLKATYCYVQSYAIKEAGGKILGRRITKKEIHNKELDKHLLTECVRDMRKFDKLVTYYGGDYRFDLPVLRTRCLFWKLDFPLYGEIKVFDLYSLVKKKLKLHSNRLGVACEFFGIEAKGHPMKPEIWFRAQTGDERSLNWIWTHNKEDVVSTEKLYYKLINFLGRQQTSI